MQSVQNSQELTCNYGHNKLLIRFIRICLMSCTLLVVNKNAFIAKVQQWDNSKRFKRSFFNSHQGLLIESMWKDKTNNTLQFIGWRTVELQSSSGLLVHWPACSPQQHTSPVWSCSKLCSELQMHTLQLHSSVTENNTITHPQNIM